jgi:hypothetical protein
MLIGGIDFAIIIQIGIIVIRLEIELMIIGAINHNPGFGALFDYIDGHGAEIISGIAGTRPCGRISG